MRLVHIVPGLDGQAPQTIRDEHSRALESISNAVSAFARGNVQLRAIVIGDVDWPSTSYSGIDILRAKIDSVGLPQGGGIRPKLRSFFVPEVTENADYVIFTNSDICVTPDFYQRVTELIDQGVLSGSIHRKTILGLDPSVAQSVQDAMTSKNWYLHPGSDCFFFPANSASALRMNELVMGVPPVGRYMLTVLGALNPSFRKFPELGITFHFGDDRIWKTSEPLRRLTNVNMRSWYLTFPKVIRLTGFRGFLRGMTFAHVSSVRDWVNLIISVAKVMTTGLVR